MKRKKIMVYVLIFIGFVSIVFLIGKINLSIKFNRQVRELFSQSKNISNRKFSYEQLADLPAPVQQYFKHVLKDGQPYISYIRLQHDGQFKTDLKKDWVNIKGEQYFTTEKPGFIWKGTTSMFVARDMYLADEGRLIATILSTINVVDIHGKRQYNESELLRWLSESIWFPTNLLPSQNLQWTAIDSLSARLTFNYNGLSLFYIVRFNDKGEIVQMETKRYMDEKRLETWIIKPGKYREINAVIIPTNAEVSWRLKEGDFSYAKFNVKTIEYNMPERF
ncbi:MAG: DUF6544 family protein [Ferruginibacter sp.]